MIYIGSTMNMNERQYMHNRYLRKGSDYPIYKYCRDHDINELEVILLECVPIEERYVVEQYYIDEFKGDKLLNAYNANADIKDQKERKKEYDKEYRINNIEKIKTYDKKRSYENRKYKNERARLYREANLEKIREQQRIRYAKKKAEKEVIS